MALAINQQPADTSLTFLPRANTTDEELLSVLPKSTLDGVKALKLAIDDRFDSNAIANTATEMPSCRSHILRP
jgi:hypothetical protein